MTAEMNGKLAAWNVWESIFDHRPRQTMLRAERIIEAGKVSTANRRALSHLEDIRLNCNGYAEPGYSDPQSGVIACGNWNRISQWNEAKHSLDTMDETPCRVAKLLERMGVELEWCDEWIECEGCYKLIRTSPNSYEWTPSYYWQDDCVILCHECVKSDPSAYLEHLEGNPRSADTIGIDLEENGYVLLQSDFEHGFHPGQDANPKVIAKSLKALGVSRFIFRIDSVGQFDMDFSVWIHSDEFAELTPDKLAEWERLPKDGPSVSDGLRRALQSASEEMSKLPDGAGVRVAKLVSPQDFVEGKGLQ